MALTAAQQNLLVAIQQSAERIITEKTRLDQLVARWMNEFSAVPTTEELQALAEFAHVTQDELTAAATALYNIWIALGEWSNPTSDVNALIKIVVGGVV